MVAPLSDNTVKPPIDLQRLAAWADDDIDNVSGILTVFDDNATEIVRDIGENIEAEDWPATALAAHKLKGAALTVGAGRLGEIAG